MAEQLPLNMATLIQSVQYLAKKGETKKTIIEYIYQVAESQGIYVYNDSNSYRNFNKNDNSSDKYSNSNYENDYGNYENGYDNGYDNYENGYDNYENGYENDYENDYENNYEIYNEDNYIHDIQMYEKINRLAFSTNKEENAKTLLCYECNGLVMDTRTWNVISLSPPLLNHYFNYNVVNNLLSQDLYDIIKIEDGTIITLYNFNDPIKGNIWCMATTNGYDVSLYKWAGDMTYAEIFYDLATRLYPKFVQSTGLIIKNQRLHFTNLDATKSYSFGFRHHNFHPLKDDPEKIWQIQYSELVPNAHTYFKKFTDDLPDQTIISDTNKIEELLHDNMQQLYHYGYILRSKNISLTTEYSFILIKSPFLHQVQRLIYDKPITFNSKKQFKSTSISYKLDHKNRMEYNFIKAWILDPVGFLSLLPDWKKRFDLYDSVSTKIIKHIVAIIDRSIDDTFNIVVTNDDKIINAAAKNILNLISFDEKFPILDSNIYSIIRDYVVNLNHTFILMDTILRLEYKV